MNVTFHPGARADLDEAVAYYEGEQPGLGGELQAEVEHAVQRILKYPESGTRRPRQCRRLRTGRFPYGVVYRARSDEVLVVAIMHLHREPGWWQYRLAGNGR